MHQKIQSNKNKLINLIFCFFPLTFIIGNTALNANVIILILLSVFFYKKNLIPSKLSNLDKLILLFFIYITFVMIKNYVEINYLNSINISHFKNAEEYLIFKTLFFLRFFLLYFVIKFTIKQKIINFKKFYFISSICCLFVIFDIFFQFFFNKDVFGFTPVLPRKLSGPFGEELIAGSYIQRFFFFIIYFIIIFFNKKEKFLFLIFPPIVISIVLSGNRMPLILTLFGLLLLCAFDKTIRKKVFFVTPLILVLFSMLYFLNPEIKKNIGSFYNISSKILKYPFSSEIKIEDVPTHLSEFESFYGTWKLNKYFGGGVRSFRIYCPYRYDISGNKKAPCNTHPHNYYLEILTELGLFGIFIILILFANILYTSFKKFFTLHKNPKNNYILLTFLILFIIEIFPLKSTGSFFSTWNSTFIFILIGCISGLNINKSNKLN